jgi:hypothetical protein
MGEAFVTRFDGVGPEAGIVKDMARKAAVAGPVLILAFGLIWGLDGALSTAYAIALVLANFAISAAILSWSARISYGLLMGAVLVVVHQPWISVVPLAITIVVTHLGLLFWEMKYVSASLAFPGLKPATVSSALSENKESSTS